MASSPGSAATSVQALRSYEIHGYAIVSDDGMIADAAGAMPEQLKNDADWAYFQAQLDLSHMVLVGRRSHQAAPSTDRRRRVVMSRSVSALEQRDNVWWWNPAAVSLAEALARLLPSGGRVAVPGGQAVFDLLAQWRAFDQFHLSRALGVRLPGGRPAFSAQARGITLESALQEQGLCPGTNVTLDPRGPVVLTVWSRRPEPVASEAER